MGIVAGSEDSRVIPFSHSSSRSSFTDFRFFPLEAFLEGRQAFQVILTE